jgi:hypothetical protein
MKKGIVLIGFVLLGFASNAQTENLLEKMNAVCSGLDTIHSTAGLKAKVDELSILKESNSGDWMSAYYYAYMSVQLSYNEPILSMKDVFIDNAEAQLTIIEEKCPLKDEVYIMKALIANARIGADPENRWQKYGKIFDENLKLAKEVNENNPHIYLLKGIATYYTPKMFGGGAKNAKTYMDKAAAKFELVTSTSADQPYWWGKSTLGWFNAMIEKDLK